MPRRRRVRPSAFSLSRARGSCAFRPIHCAAAKMTPIILFSVLLAFANAALQPTSKHGRRPNIVVIVTDDQDSELGGLDPMHGTRALLERGGMRFANAFATTPVCCPSRASIWSGLYQHNHRTLNNSVTGNCNGAHWRNHTEPHSVAARLHASGYATFYAGKYLNQYGVGNAGGPQHVPAGFDTWLGLVGNSRYYNYHLSSNGRVVRHGHLPADYLTDVVRHAALGFIREKHDDKPMFVVASVPAPHAPFTPAERHKNAYHGKKAPRTASYGIVSPDKHWLTRTRPALTNHTKAFVDDIYRHRWETLLAVDDLVVAVVAELEERNVLGDTFVFFLSDHGFHFGQFSMRYDKRQPYEFDIRLPLLVRGPGVRRGAVSRRVVLNIDLAPTWLALAGLGADGMDGQSFADELLNGGGRGGESSAPGRDFLLEYHGENNADNSYGPLFVDEQHIDKFDVKSVIDCKNDTYMCLRRLGTNCNISGAFNSTDCILCDFDDAEQFTELYAIDRDPAQLDNLAVSARDAARSGIGELRRAMKRIRET